MKFTKQQAFESLKAKMGTSQKISDRSINESLDAMMQLAGEETELASFTDMLYPTFKAMDGNIRNEVSTRLEEIEKGKKPETTPPSGNEDLSKLMEAFQEFSKSTSTQIADLTSQLNNEKQLKTVAERRLEIVGLAEKKFPKTIVEGAIMDFDFSKATALEDFGKKCDDLGKLLGVKPMTGEENTPPVQDAAYFQKQHEAMKASGAITE